MKYKYWLSNVTGIGPKKINILLSKVNHAKELYELTDKQLRKIEGISEKDKERILMSKKGWNLEKEYEKLCKKNIKIYAKDEKDYPKKIKNLPDAPYLIYVKGSLPDEDKKTVSIVGARECSEYGKAVAKEIAYVLAKNKVEIVSGLARGIDTFAHVGAIHAKSPTYAVLGCGVDICYPTENREIYQRIVECGGLISEYPPGTKPQSKLFPARNRIISALSDIVVIVEARDKSGSLITADFALEQGKEIYAVPGRLKDELSLGCNRLISQGAGIFLTIEDFMEMNDICKDKKLVEASYSKNLLEKQEMVVYSCLDLQPKSMEEIIFETGIGLSELSMILIELQKKEMIRESFKNYYIRSF